MVCLGEYVKNTRKLLFSRCATCRKKDSIIQSVFVRMQLIIGHGIVTAFKPIDILDIFKWSVAQVGYPKAFGGVASCRLSLIRTLAFQIGTAAFLQSDNPFLTGYSHWKGQMGIGLPVFSGCACQKKMVCESTLGIKRDATVLEIAVEFLLAIPIIEVEMDKLIIVQVKSHILLLW